MDGKRIIQLGLDNVDRATERALDGLSVAEIAWQPRPDANSIGLILFHMARSEDSYIQRLIQHQPQLWETAKWYEKLHKDKTDAGSHYSAEQVASFMVPDLKDLGAYALVVRQQTISFLNGLTPEQLDEKIELPPMPSGQSAPRRFPFEPVVGSLLMWNVVHLAEHAGEISYLRGLQRGMDK